MYKHTHTEVHITNGRVHSEKESLGNFITVWMSSPVLTNLDGTAYYTPRPYGTAYYF